MQHNTITEMSNKYRNSTVTNTHTYACKHTNLSYSPVPGALWLMLYSPHAQQLGHSLRLLQRRGRNTTEVQQETHLTTSTRHFTMGKAYVNAITSPATWSLVKTLALVGIKVAIQTGVDDILIQCEDQS